MGNNRIIIVIVMLLLIGLSYIVGRYINQYLSPNIQKIFRIVGIIITILMVGGMFLFFHFRP